MDVYDPSIFTPTGWQKPLVIRASAGEFIRFSIGYNADYNAGSAGRLILGAPMWSSNCGAEPCVSDAEPVCPGDLDNSGTVSISDLLLLLSVYGAECP